MSKLIFPPYYIVQVPNKVVMNMPDERYQAQLPFDGFFRRPGRPPGRGPTFGPPSVPPFGPPAGVPGQQGPPQGPPPPFIPQRRDDGISIRAVDPGSIRPCLFRYVYIWLENGRQFWAWLVFVGPRSVAGWRWTGFNWVFFGTDLENISSFVCV